MLKPKKEIFKKEIKRDPFLETIDKIEASIEKNSNDYIKIIGGVVLFIIIISFLINSRNLNKEMVSTSLGNALVSMDKGDSENAKFQFETLLNDHSGTSGIELAHYYLGKIEYDRGDYLVAKEYLEIFINSDYSVDLLTSGAVIMISDILSKSDRYLEAIDIIDKGIGRTEKDYIKQKLKVEKAKLFIKSGENQLGLELLDMLSESENISSRLEANIEEIIGLYRI